MGNEGPGCVKLQLPLEDNRSKGNVSVTGTLQCVLHWMPDTCLEKAEDGTILKKDGTTKPKAGVVVPSPMAITAIPEPPEASIWEGQRVPELVGVLSVEVQHATGLLNLDTRLNGLADPFCRVTVYTHFSGGECRDESRP